jgi:hypothetical protein
MPEQRWQHYLTYTATRSEWQFQLSKISQLTVMYMKTDITYGTPSVHSFIDSLLCILKYMSREIKIIVVSWLWGPLPYYPRCARLSAAGYVATWRSPFFPSNAFLPTTAPFCPPRFSRAIRWRTGFELTALATARPFEVSTRTLVIG